MNFSLFSERKPLNATGIRFSLALVCLYVKNKRNQGFCSPAADSQKTSATGKNGKRTHIPFPFAPYLFFKNKRQSADKRQPTDSDGTPGTDSRNGTHGRTPPVNKQQKRKTAGFYFYYRTASGDVADSWTEAEGTGTDCKLASFLCPFARCLCFLFSRILLLRVLNTLSRAVLYSLNFCLNNCV